MEPNTMRFSKAHAIELAKRFLNVTRAGKSEVRLMFDMSPLHVQEPRRPHRLRE
jgi:hypothetical protein